jgi:hypothetical protein
MARTQGVSMQVVSPAGSEEVVAALQEVVRPGHLPQAEEDFLPIQAVEYVEYWVGNAYQAAQYYRTHFGFDVLAYAGPETGVRDRASYVLRQGEITFVFTAPLTPDSEIARHVSRTRRRCTRHRAARARRRRRLP